MAKRGRPKNDRPARDSGTRELQRQRAQLVAGGDSVLAGYPLGVLLARRIITQDQHNAGCRYAWLYGKATGRWDSAGLVWERLLGAGGASADAGETDDAALYAKWKDATAALLAAGRRAKDGVDNLAVFNRLPAWIADERGTSIRSSWTRERGATLAGLQALAKALGLC
ncbi:MAG: hypothetical protein ACT4P2_09475 [Pseudomonadota bacterium]